MRNRLVNLVLVASLASSAAVGVAAVPTAGAAGPPKCTFNNSVLPIVMNTQPGTKVTVACTGLTALNPYLVLQASLLIGIDPEAKALLSGSSGVSPAVFTAAVAALPKVNPASLTVKLSDANGNLTFDYTVPSTQAPDPNATCPPSGQQFNSGLIGCALAMVDVVTQKPVAAGSAVLEYAGFPFLPPGPTLGLWGKKVFPGQTVPVRDAVGASTYWWVSTLGALNNLLTGSNSTPTVTVAFGVAKKPVYAMSNVIAAPASYSNSTFTPPRLSGSFKVPTFLRGGKRVTVTATQSVLGLPLTNSAWSRVKILP